MIYGATGSIGTAAVQLATHLGADVTAVCRGEHADLVRALGADRVIDYEHEDFTRAGDDFDVVLDAVGKRSFGRVQAAAARRRHLRVDRPRPRLAEPATHPRHPVTKRRRDGSHPEVPAGARHLLQATCSRPARCARSSTVATRWPTSSRRRATSRRVRRSATSCSPSTPDAAQRRWAIWNTLPNGSRTIARRSP